MTDEEAVQETTEEAPQDVKETGAQGDANREKYRLISGEEILENGEARGRAVSYTHLTLPTKA